MAFSKSNFGGAFAQILRASAQLSERGVDLQLERLFVFLFFSFFYFSFHLYLFCS